MKTTLYTLILLLTLNAGIVTAGGFKHSTSGPLSSISEMTIDLEKLAPAVPAVAEFTDGTEYNTAPGALVSKLAPVTPKEADFEDAGPGIRINIELLAPSTPIEPLFEDTIGDPETDAHPTFAPATPAEADFTE